MPARPLAWVAVALALAGCSARSIPEPAPFAGPIGSFEGPDRTVIDLLRTQKGGPRIFVQAEIGDSGPLLFMVDTGADVNVLSTSVAEELGLAVTEGAIPLAGLSGTMRAGLTVAPRVQLGDATLERVPFAVGVRGVGETAGFMPLAGILGMEVWRRFTLEIEYPRDRMVLHRPGTARPLRRAAPLYYSGSSIETGIEVTTDSEPPIVETVVVQVDTGASALLLAGQTGRPFAEASTLGLEPVYGVGASEFLPPSRFLRATRRIPVRRVTLGGRSFKAAIQAQWLDFDRPDDRSSLQTRGLIGHRLLAGHRVWLDPLGGRIALRRPGLLRRKIDGHRVLLDQDRERYGDVAPARDLYRARLRIGLDDFEAALGLLERYVDAHPGDAEGRVLLARARRYLADLPGAWEAIGDLGPARLTDEGELLATVNGLIYDGDEERALSVAREAVRERPDAAEAFLALADALSAVGELREAGDAVLAAARLRQNPYGFLLRRSRLALAEGDRDGAMARVRRLVQEYPTDGKYLWFYALMLRTPAEVDTFRADMEDAMDRLHPDLRPLDYLVAAHHAIGDEKTALATMREGVERDCDLFRDRPSRWNCVAWYHSLAHHDLARASRMIERALERTGPRADFLDTKAVVHLGRGELEAAREAALGAARLMPDDPYMQWQLERIAALQAPSAPAP